MVAQLENLMPFLPLMPFKLKVYGKNMGKIKRHQKLGIHF
jgi:hypothetical protein